MEQELVSRPLSGSQFLEQRAQFGEVVGHTDLLVRLVAKSRSVIRQLDASTEVSGLDLSTSRTLDRGFRDSPQCAPPP